MIIFAVLSGVSIFISYKLPETLGIPPEDEIKELREIKISVDNQKIMTLL